MSKKKKFPIDPFELRLLLPIMVIVIVFVIMINPLLGIIVGVLAWISYKKIGKGISTQEKTPQQDTVNEDTKHLIGTLINEQATQKQEPYDYSSHLIKRGSLPSRIHDILDEMEITTWMQLSLLDEKELLYQKCFGEKALRDIKAGLSTRGLTLNSPKSTI